MRGDDRELSPNPRALPNTEAKWGIVWCGKKYNSLLLRQLTDVGFFQLQCVDQKWRLEKLIMQDNLNKYRYASRKPHC